MITKVVDLYLGCSNDRPTRRIEYNDERIDYWDEKRLHKIGLKTDNISGFKVGPKTVTQIYSDPFFYSLRKTLVNDKKDDELKWDVGCFIDHGVWNGIIRSFKIWDYDYYMSIHGTRYCESDKDCRNYEKCLCRGGQKNPDWCPESKRRCMHKSQFLHDAERKARDSDLVNLECLKKEINDNIKEYGNKYEIFNNIKNMVKKCSGPDKDPSGYQDLSLQYYYKADSFPPSLKSRHNLISKRLYRGIEGFGTSIETREFPIIITIIVVVTFTYFLLSYYRKIDN